MNTRMTLSIGLAAMLFNACTTPPPCPPVAETFVHPLSSIPESADANIAVVENHLNALITANVEGIRSTTAPGYYANDTFVPGDSTDTDGVIAHWMANDSARTDQKIEKVFAECVSVAAGDEYAGDWVHYWGTYSATNKAVGKAYKVPFFLDSRVEDGKITKSYLYYDRLSVFNQLGIAPPPPVAVK